MYRMKFLDGTEVDHNYAKQIAKAVGAVCDAEELVEIDELEKFAAQQQMNLTVPSV